MFCYLKLGINFFRYAETTLCIYEKKNTNQQHNLHTGLGIIGKGKIDYHVKSWIRKYTDEGKYAILKKGRSRSA